MSVKNIQNLDDFKAIINENKTVLIDFSATWCGPCKAISPIYEKFSKINPNVVFCKVDIDEALSVAEEFSVRNVPTFMYFKGGKRVEDATLAGANVDALMALASQASQDYLS